jgi:hypothetical protein
MAPVLVGAGVSLLCLRSIAAGGYLLQVDATFGPVSPPLPQGFGAPVGLLLHGLAAAVGWALVGRLYIVVALALAVALPMFLFPSLPWYTRTALGLLGGLNPFVYDRLVEGQWGVVVAAALLVAWLALFERLASRPGPAPALGLAAVSAAAASFSPHFIPMMAVLFVAGAAARGALRSRPLMLWTLAAIAATALLLLPGLVSFLLGSDGTTLAAIRQVGRADFVVFASSTGGPFGLFKLFGLYGYWAERIGRFPSASSTTLWFPAAALLTAGAFAGAWVSRSRAWLLPVGLVGLVVSASTTLPGGVDAAAALARTLPLFGGIREPGKWLALWLLALVVLNGELILAVHRRSRSGGYGGPVAAALLILAVIIPAGAVTGLQLSAGVQPVEYPGDWYRAAAALDRGAGPDAVVVVLPWHLYQTMDFTGGRLTSNPASVFFRGRLLTSNDAEIPGDKVPPGPQRDIGAAAPLATSPGCALAGAVRGVGAHWVVVEPADGADVDATSLELCGFALVSGGPGEVEVLRG